MLIGLCLLVVPVGICAARPAGPPQPPANAKAGSHAEYELSQTVLLGLCFRLHCQQGYGTAMSTPIVACAEGPGGLYRAGFAQTPERV